MRVPITDMAVLSALGGDLGAVRAALREGRSGLGEPPIGLPFRTVFGGLPAGAGVDGPDFGAGGTRVERMAARLVSQIAGSVERAVGRWGAERVGVYLGTSTGGLRATEEAWQARVRTGALPAGYDYWRDHGYETALEAVRRRTGAKGPGLVVSTACSSSAKVVGSALRAMKAGRIDAAVVGGLDTLSEMTLRGFHAMGILSEGACRPFSSERAGINIGEGGALLLLEREGKAPVSVLGVGESSDAFHMTSPHPDGAGALAAMAAALGQAGLRARDVDHVNAHGTGTKQNDAAEARAIRELLGPAVPVVSTKGYTGHLLGGCGAVELVHAACAILDGLVPASLGASPVDPELPIDVATEARALPCRVVLSNAFAFGGNNVSVALGANG